MPDTSYLIALGSNRRGRAGDPADIIRAAAAALGVERLSRIRATPALGPAGRSFANAAARLTELVRTAIEGAGGRTQYVELVAPDTLAPLAVAVPGSVLAVAAFVDGTRLIDNIVLT